MSGLFKLGQLPFREVFVAQATVSKPDWIDADFSSAGSRQGCSKRSNTELSFPKNIGYMPISIHAIVATC